MKLLIAGDLHMGKSSSIVTSQGNNFSTRLENCIKTVNWVEQMAVEHSVDAVVYLGDFFNRPELDDETITAARSITWSKVYKYFIIGNHESTAGDLRYCSTDLFEGPGFEIIKTPTVITTENTDILMLPYIRELDRKPLAEYWPDDYKQLKKQRLLLMHNDLSGVFYGPIMSTVGFNKEDILQNSDFCVNGHLHNGAWLVQNRLLTIGNLTGQNFSEDANIYSHRILLWDTATSSFELLENPHALNFYKIDLNTATDFLKLETLKPNAVVSIRCKESLLELARQQLPTLPFVATRLVAVPEAQEEGSEMPQAALIQVDHLAKFIECCRERLENSEILEQELLEICK